MTTPTLEELSRHRLQDIYDAEQQALAALGQLQEAASTPALQELFGQHLRETQRQVLRLEQIFALLGVPAQGTKCLTMQQLITEARTLIARPGDPVVKDAALIAVAQQQEHYEIAAYRTARTWATLLGRHGVAALLDETLAEEQATDALLSDLAEGAINAPAVGR